MKKAIDTLTKVFRLVSCGIFAVIIVVTIANIVGRTFFDSPVKGSVEIIQYGFMLAIAIVMARSGYENKHIAVDLLTSRFGPRASKCFYTLGSLGGLVVFSGIAYLTFSDMLLHIGGRTTETLHVPYSFLYGVICAGFTLGSLVFLFQFISALVSVIKNDCGPDLRHMDENEKAKMIAKEAEEGNLN